MPMSNYELCVEALLSRLVVSSLWPVHFFLAGIHFASLPGQNSSFLIVQRLVSLSCRCGALEVRKAFGMGEKER